MAIGIVSDLELERELLNSQSLANTEKAIHKEILQPGRQPGDNNVPPALRKVIADETLEGGRASGLKLAAEFGISSSSVSAYVKGVTSTAKMDEPDADLTLHVEKSKARITNSARERIEYALNAITEEKLEAASLQIAASVAKDMSAIVRNMEPAGGADGGNKTQFVFYVPPMKAEQDFDVIDVKG